MSRLVKKRMRPEREEEYIAELRCDICGRKAPKPGGDHPWKEEIYDIHDVDVKLREGDQYPDSGSGEETSFDICPKCFKERLIPALFAMGAQPRKVDWSY